MLFRADCVTGSSAGPAGEAVDAFGKVSGGFYRLVDDYALGRIDRLRPRSTIEHLTGIVVSRLPSHTYAFRREVDVLGVVLAVEVRCVQSRHVHGRTAAPAGQLAHFGRLARGLGHALGELPDDVPQVVDLLLARDMALGAAGILDVLGPPHDLPHRLGFGAFGVPHVDREYQRVLARVVVQYGFDRGVGINPAIPLGIAVDPNRGKRRRQRARGEDVVEIDGLVAAVKVTHLTVARVDGTDGKPGVTFAVAIELDQLRERFPKRCRRIVGSFFGAKRNVRRDPCGRVGHEETRNALHDRRT